MPSLAVGKQLLIQRTHRHIFWLRFASHQPVSHQPQSMGPLLIPPTCGINSFNMLQHISYICCFGGMFIFAQNTTITVCYRKFLVRIKQIWDLLGMGLSAFWSCLRFGFLFGTARAGTTSGANKKMLLKQVSLLRCLKICLHYSRYSYIMLY